MNIETYVVETNKSDRHQGSTYGPYGYDNQGKAHEAAKERAAEVNGIVVAYSFEFEDSEMVDDFTEEANP